MVGGDVALQICNDGGQCRSTMMVGNDMALQICNDGDGNVVLQICSNGKPRCDATNL